MDSGILFLYLLVSFVLVLIIPCGCCCYRNWFGNEIPSNCVPSNAEPIHSPEREEILGELAGLWQIVPVSVIEPTVECCVHKNESMRKLRLAAFSQACVSGDTVAYSGGPYGRWQNYTIILKRTPQGTLYLDQLGSYVEVWDKQKEEITIYNNLQKSRIIWRREGVQKIVMQQPIAPVLHPAPVAPAPVVVVLPAWWSTMTDPSGRVYYRNAHKGTTSWTPPSAEQIAAETRERQIQEYGGTGAGAEGALPPAFNA